jgi:hypothetical protein
LATNIEKQDGAFKQRRTDHAEKSFGSIELRFGVGVPDFLARGKVETVKRSFCSKCVNLPRRDRGCGSGAFIKTKIISIRGWIIIRPETLARGGVQALDRFLVSGVDGKDQFRLAITGPLKPCPPFLPNNGGPSLASDGD